MKYRPQIEWDVVWLISGVLITCAVGAAYYANIRPLRDPATNGRLLLDTFASQIIAYGKTKGVKLRLNILTIHNGFFYFRRHLKIAWPCYFRMAWASWWKTKDFYKDGAISFGIKKGVAGLAVKELLDFLVDMEEPVNRDRDWGFTDEEKKQLPPLTMIWSFPIFEVNKEGDMTGKILGTLSLDSEDPGAFDIVLKDPEFRTRMIEFREIACKVTSV